MSDIQLLFLKSIYRVNMYKNLEIIFAHVVCTITILRINYKYLYHIIYVIGFDRVSKNPETGKQQIFVSPLTMLNKIDVP